MDKLVEIAKTTREILHSVSIIGLIAYAVYTHADTAEFRQWVTAETGGLEARTAPKPPIAGPLMFDNMIAPSDPVFPPCVLDMSCNVTSH